MMRIEKVIFNFKSAIGNMTRVKGLINVPKSKSMIFPEMIPLSDKLSIMRREATVGLFRQVMQGYRIIGHNADKLQAILDGTSHAKKALTCVSLFDDREFARRFSEQFGRKFRCITDDEWRSVPSDIKARLKGSNWFWTETKIKSGNGTHGLSSLGRGNLYSSHPDNRYDYAAIRLVEDK
jgi:hypothetical protein